jgi:hypothetical protein
MLRDSRSARSFMSSGLPLRMSRANSSEVKGNVSTGVRRTAGPKTRLNQNVSRRMEGLSPPAG